MLATVGVAFALLITAVELSKDGRQPVYDLNLKRGSPEYTLFLAVRPGSIPITYCFRHAVQAFAESSSPCHNATMLQTRPQIKNQQSRVPG